MEVKKKELNASGTVYKPSAPYEASILETTCLTGEGSEDDIRHIIIDIKGSGIQYKEGQSIGVQTPGTDETGKKHRVRIYSIASRREGESTADTLALTVKRVVYTDENTGKKVNGLASNYICDLKSNDKINITGPIGRTFVLPEDNTTDLIMVAVGTGIAPFRAFIHHAYSEHKAWRGKVLLFFGSKTGLESLYMNDVNGDISQYYEVQTFTAFQALSREGDKKYVQDHIHDNREQIWDIIEKGNFSFYVCGLKGIEEGINKVLGGLASEKGKNWEDMTKQFKADHRWHIETY